MPSRSRPPHHDDPSRPPYLPLDPRNTDFLTALLIVLKPLPLTQIYSRELGARVRPFSKPLAICLEIDKLQSSTVKFQDLERFIRFVLCVVGFGRGDDAGRVLSLLISCPVSTVLLQ